MILNIKKIMLSKISFRIFILQGLFLSFLNGYSQDIQNVRFPANSSFSVPVKGCKVLMNRLLDDSIPLSKELWEPENLPKQGRINMRDFKHFKENSECQSFISRKNQTDEEREMAFVILSIIKKKYKNLTDEALKDRYLMLKSFCTL